MTSRLTLRYTIAWTNGDNFNVQFARDCDDNAFILTMQGTILPQAEANRWRVLLPSGSTWKYLDNGSNLGTDWRLPTFDDATWPSGPAELGYGDLDEATTNRFGSNPANKYITTYDVASSEIGGTKVDSWTLDMQPADPAMGDGGLGMVKGFLTGPAGKFQGVVAPVKGGLILTYTQYEPIVAAVLKTAAEGNGLSKGLESAASALPPDRSFELFLGTKSIMETISGVMGMFGQAPMPVPADIAHIAMGGTSDSGGIQIRTIVPATVFKAMAELQKSMKGPEPMDEEPAEPASKEDKKDTKPKF